MDLNEQHERSLLLCAPHRYVICCFHCDAQRSSHHKLNPF
jgi:hypothetical protein